MPQKVAIARRGGWLGEAFITPNGVIGDSEERIYYEPAGNAKPIMTKRAVSKNGATAWAILPDTLARSP